MTSAQLDRTLAEQLAKLSLLKPIQLTHAIELATSQQRSLVDVLVDSDLIKDSDLGQIVADLLGRSFVNLSQRAIDLTDLLLIPKRVARAQQTVVFASDSDSLSVASSNLQTTQLIDFLAKKTQKRVKLFYATPLGITKALGNYSQDVHQAFKHLIEDSVNNTAQSDQDPPIINLVDTIISYAYQFDASDIHIEPLEEHILVRFRVDGILQDITILPLDIAPQIITRIKVLANLRTDEHQAAQDGKISYQPSDSEHDIDIRVSIVPTTKGEKAVLRLLSERARQFSLSDLGLAKSDLEKVTRAYQHPHGMVLATGPTGSGKTTTLYAILKLLNNRDVNIMTIEDPVEYEIDHVNQIQVNNQTDLTFAKGLRSIVRQDPNIILVGEIRDNDTADIAINASLTGHLVLSTLHTTDAATAFPRLLDMDVEPFLVASTVTAVIAQRLVRKLCTQCRVSTELEVSAIDPHLARHLGDLKTLRTYKGKGCTACHQSGYAGRIGIYEVIQVSDAVREAIIAKQDASQISELAQQEGMTTMVQDGLEKVKQGITSLEEIMRVIKE